MAVKLFTHTDLDGIGCAVVAMRLFDSVDATFCDYNEIDSVVSEFVANGGLADYDDIFITDISVDEHVAKEIEDNYENNVQLIDHHATAEWLNKYGWAYVKSEDSTGKTSGTSMLFEHLSILTDDDESLRAFAETVRCYDTWEWKTRYDDDHPKRLNDLFYLIGRDKFISRFMVDPLPYFSAADEMLLEVNEAAIARYIDSKRDQITVKEIAGLPAGVVFAEQHQSELGHALATERPDLDLIAMINPARSVSFRTAKDDVNLGEIAKSFGGGGHAKAAGAPVDGAKLIDQLFE
ncbi:DHH family phosphoesterase [Salibacterium lacus]|uniref:DHH family phosphoesterase n=1 Tax=Salibacterium lacus TaxID=1898109 RepID=A0ABW5SYA2_9BACI